MILERLGIYGWKEQDEDLVMASLLTGDPLLLVGNHESPSMSDELKQRLKKHGLVTLTILFDDAHMCDDFAGLGEVIQLGDIRG